MIWHQADLSDGTTSMRPLHLTLPEIVLQMSSPSGGSPKLDQGLAYIHNDILPMV
jgi:hypothetical protein